MRSDSENTFNVFNNPIDEIEEIVNSYELDFLRNTLNELILSYKGLWNNYEISFNWDHSISRFQKLYLFASVFVSSLDDSADIYKLQDAG